MSGARMLTAESREVWLKERLRRIGGSECAALIGCSPWLTNVDLWEIKTGRRQREEISGDAVAYGAAAEAHLRQLYALDHTDMDVSYTPDNIWVDDTIPFAHASLDGWLKDCRGRFGVLEIKTATAQSALQWRKWDGRIPDHYYCQICWYMMVTGAEFADLRAYIRGARSSEIRDYRVERSEAAEDIAALYEAGAAFWAWVEDDVRPPLVLPEI